MNIRAKLFLIMFFIVIMAGCTRRDETRDIPRRRPASVEIEEPEEIKIPAYTYGGSVYRNPFSPAAARPRDEDADELFARDLNLAGLRVSGIMSDRKSKYAILSGPGEYYIVRQGRLLDEDDRMVSGVAAIVSEDKVTLIIEDEMTISLPAPRW